MSDHEFLSNLNDNLTIKPISELKNEQLVLDLSSGRLQFLNVVESIQGVLTNENASIRERGIEFLSWLLKELPSDLFNYSEINVIVNFYCECLRGHHNIIPPTIRGLLTLMKMKRISREEIIKILVNMFQNVNCQTQLQPDRLVIYSILKMVMENYFEEIQGMGPDFVFGLISFIEGEADPSCLILLFNFLPAFIRNFNLGHLAEEMFEVLSCYFPIDFNALISPAETLYQLIKWLLHSTRTELLHMVKTHSLTHNEKSTLEKYLHIITAKENVTVTREDLSEGLLQCLSASESFCEQSVPLILEKVDSTFKTAKLDSYKLLSECCKTLRVDSLEKHLNELWKTLAKDVLPGNDKQISEAGLSALSDVVHLLSGDESHQSILHTFLDDILSTVKSLTNRIDENMFQPAIKVLAVASSKSKSATMRILRHLKTFHQPTSSTTLMEKKITLSAFLPLLRSCHKYQLRNSEDPEVVSNYLDLVVLYLSCSTAVDHEVRKLAYMGIWEVLPDSSQEFRRSLYEIVIDNIKTKNDIRNSEEFLQIWRRLAQNNDAEFNEILSKIISTNQDEEQLAKLLWALSFIADLPNFTGFVVPIFLNSVTGLESLLNACRFAKTNNSTEFFHVIYSDHDILDRLVSWCLESLCENPCGGKTLPVLSEIIALIVRNQSLEIQQVIIDKFTGVFLGEAALTTLNGGGNVPPISKNFFPEKAQTVLVLEAILGSIRPETKIPALRTLRERLLNLSLTSTDDAVRLSSSRLLGIFINKSDSDLFTEIFKDISTHLESSDSKLKLNCAFLFTWMVKGMILRDGHLTEEWLSTWFGLLGRKDIGETIAEGFRIVIEEDVLYLNLESHANIKVLYRQRLFGSHLRLVKLYEAAEDSIKMNYLLALVRLLQGVPVHLIKMEISNIITILVRCLDVDKPEVLLTSLEILSILIQSREQIFSDHIQNFVPRFLKLSKFESHMKIRMTALQCLYHYGYYPTVDLLPIKNQVIRELECCLDDKKRLARKEAVRTRCRWFLVGAPGEDILGS